MTVMIRAKRVPSVVRQELRLVLSGVQFVLRTKVKIKSNERIMKICKADEGKGSQGVTYSRSTPFSQSKRAKEEEGNPKNGMEGDITEGLHGTLRDKGLVKFAYGTVGVLD